LKLLIRDIKIKSGKQHNNRPHGFK